MKAGDTVKFSKPVGDEAALRFDVQEVNGDRALIRLRCTWPIAPTQIVDVRELELAADEVA